MKIKSEEQHTSKHTVLDKITDVLWYIIISVLIIGSVHYYNENYEKNCRYNYSNIITWNVVFKQLQLFKNRI